jgi:hypothetical protein
MAAMASLSKSLSYGYATWLEALKGCFNAGRSRAALAVKAGVIHLYHQIGRDIQERQAEHGWGAKVIYRLADDLKTAFPDRKDSSGINPYGLHFAQSIASTFNLCSGLLHNYRSPHLQLRPR